MLTVSIARDRSFVFRRNRRDQVWGPIAFYMLYCRTLCNRMTVKYTGTLKIRNGSRVIIILIVREIDPLMGFNLLIGHLRALLFQRINVRTRIRRCRSNKSNRTIKLFDTVLSNYHYKIYRDATMLVCRRYTLACITREYDSVVFFLRS